VDVRLPRTHRLNGEPIGPAHRDELVALFAHPRVGDTMGGVWPAARIDALVARDARHWAEHGFGAWAFFDAATGAFAGRGGLGALEHDGDAEVEVAWTVVPGRWGEGLATEMGGAALAAAFGPLALPDLIALTQPFNARSLRVMEKLGFTYERDTVHAGLPHVLHRRLAPVASPGGAFAAAPVPAPPLPGGASFTRAGWQDAFVDPDAAEVKAAGGVVWRRGEDGIELALVHRPRYDDWSLPKGKLDAGEGWEAAALREVEEECGLRCALGDELSPVGYTDGRGRAKVVRYWLMQPCESPAFAPNEEVDELRWSAPESAAALLTYDRDVELVREAVRRLPPG
jgi:8-oxo-dGTP diphosphatase